MRFVFPLIILLTAVPGHADTLTKNVCPTEFRVASRETCNFLAGSWTYALDSAGMLTRRRHEITETIDLQLAASDFVNDLLFAEYGSDLILVYEVSDNESGAGRVARLGTDPLQIKWTLEFPGFNLSVGLINRSYLYQAAIGFVSKVDLKTGEYVWRHGNLYGARNYGKLKAFNAFAVPSLEGSEVLFPDAPYPRRRTVFVIRVNAESGLISFDDPS